jgi:riboflavin synthase
VDGVAELVSFAPVGNAADYWLEIKIPEHLARYVVEKGSIAIEGISLTVARFENAQVSIAIIPHTRNATNLASKQPGDLLNIEVDVLAKYTEKLGAKTGHLKPPRAELSVIDLVARGF